MKTLLTAVAMLAWGLSAMAQEEYPRTELFGGTNLRTWVHR